MISHRVTRRPEKLATLIAGLKHRWMVPFRAFEWFWEWVAYGLSHWSFLEVLEYLGSFSVRGRIDLPIPAVPRERQASV